MPSPHLVSHNLSGLVPTDVRIRMEFDEPLLETSVGMQSIMLTPQGSFSLLHGKYTYSEQGGRGVVEILPDYLLDASQRYSLTVSSKLLGADQAPVAKLALDFTTAAAVTEPPLEDSPIGGAAAGSLTLKSSVPADGAYNLNTDPAKGKLVERLVLTFSEPVDQAQWPAEPASWDDLPVQVAIGRIDDDPRFSVRQPEPVSVTVEGAKVTIELSLGDGTVYNTAMDEQAEIAHSAQITLSPNTLVIVSLPANLKAASGASLAAERQVTFSTELFPKYGSVRGLFWRWRHVTQVLDLSERELDYLIWEESNWLSIMMLRREPTSRVDLPRQSWFDFVRCKVLWQILTEAMTLQAMQGSIQDKQLGQFRITKNFATTPKPVQQLLDTFEKCWQNNLGNVLPVKTFTSAIRGLSSPYRRQFNPNAIAARRMDGMLSDATPNPWARMNPHAQSPGISYSPETGLGTDIKTS